MTESNPEDRFATNDAYDDVDIEAPEADVLEQRTSTREDPERSDRGATPFEADPADAVEQGHAVEDDEDEYRDS